MNRGERGSAPGKYGVGRNTRNDGESDESISQNELKRWNFISSLC